MPTRRGIPYLLGESSESHSTLVDPQQVGTMFADLQAQLKGITQAYTEVKRDWLS